MAKDKKKRAAREESDEGESDTKSEVKHKKKKANPKRDSDSDGETKEKTTSKKKKDVKEDVSLRPIEVQKEEYENVVKESKREDEVDSNPERSLVPVPTMREMFQYTMARYNTQKTSPHYFAKILTEENIKNLILLKSNVNSENAEGAYKAGFTVNGKFEEMIIRSPPLEVKVNKTYGIGVSGSETAEKFRMKHKLILITGASEEYLRLDPDLAAKQSAFVYAMQEILLRKLRELLYATPHRKAEKDTLELNAKKLGENLRKNGLPEVEIHKMMKEQIEDGWAALIKYWVFHGGMNGTTVLPADKPGTFRFSHSAFYPKQKGQKGPNIQSAKPIPLPLNAVHQQTEQKKVGLDKLPEGANPNDYTLTSGGTYVRNILESYDRFGKNLSPQEVWSIYHELVTNGNYTFSPMYFSGPDGVRLDLGSKTKDLTHVELHEGDIVELDFKLYACVTLQTVVVSLQMMPNIVIVRRCRNPKTPGTNATFGTESSLADIRTESDLQSSQTNFGNVTITEVTNSSIHDDNQRIALTIDQQNDDRFSPQVRGYLTPYEQHMASLVKIPEK